MIAPEPSANGIGRLVHRGILFWHTVQYLKPIQVTSRIKLKGKATFRRAFPKAAQRYLRRLARRSDLHPPSTLWRRRTEANLDHHCQSESWNEAVESANAALLGRFRFLNNSAELGRPISWTATDQSQLWRYHLHYGAYLLDLVATTTKGWAAAVSLMSEWIAACRVGEHRDSWHPFVVSERVVNWLLTIQLGAPSSSAVPNAVWKSITEQCLFLDCNLETDVGGNHLLKNLKALSIASVVFNGATAERWREEYIPAFDRELARQLLPDGAHYERSPMYHCLVLSDAIDVVFALRISGRTVSPSLIDSIDRMLAHLRVVTHPDGRIALLNDSVLNEAPTPAELTSAAAMALGTPQTGSLSVRHSLLAGAIDAAGTIIDGERQPVNLQAGEIIRLPLLGHRGLLLADFGPACPDELPAHAHADFFSFELSLDGRRMIVDSGVGEYAEGPWREYYRSTRAHNTVEIDATDQIECWASFRVARRANILGRTSIAGAVFSGTTGWHDGYKRLRDPIAVGRTIVTLDDTAWLIIDEFETDGTHAWESHIHAAPATEIAIVNPSCAMLAGEGRQAAIAWFGASEARTVQGQTDPKQGWYAEEFGSHTPVWTLTLSGTTSRPCGYVIAPDREPREVSIAHDGNILRVMLGNAHYNVTGSGASLNCTRDDTT